MGNKHYNLYISKILEKIKWFFVLVFLILSFCINYYFYKIALFIRITMIFFLLSCAIIILLNTRKGKNLYSFVHMSAKEMKKITWPTYQDTFYTTVLVISVTIILSFLLWIFDNIIFRLIAFLIS